MIRSLIVISMLAGCVKFKEKNYPHTPDKPSGEPQDKYAALCAPCHGQNGDGKGATPVEPAPRNFSDASWQASVTDDHIAKVIKEGGASVGLSPVMPSWKSSLSDEEVTKMVEKIRSFKK